MNTQDYKKAALALKEHNAWAMGGWDKWLHWALESAYERGVEEFESPEAEYHLDKPIQLRSDRNMLIHIRGKVVMESKPPVVYWPWRGQMDLVP